MAVSHSETKVSSRSRATVIDIPESLEPNPARLTPNQKLSANVIDFLREFANGEIGISRKTWVGKVLPTTNMALSHGVGFSIRDELIRLGWAEWNYETGKNNGWRLVLPANEILEKIAPK